MISIEGLTQRQRQIMDLLWACETQDEAEDLILNLPEEKDRWDGLGLITIAIQEVMEEEGHLSEHRNQALAAINRARLNGLR